MSTEEKKIEYWNYFIANKHLWGHGMTQKRLEKVKSVMWDNGFFWSDIIECHEGDTRTPEELKAEDESTYDHCFGNMCGMLMHAMLEKNIIKTP